MYPRLSIYDHESAVSPIVSFDDAFVSISIIVRESPRARGRKGLDGVKAPAWTLKPTQPASRGGDKSFVLMLGGIGRIPLFNGFP